MKNQPINKKFEENCHEFSENEPGQKKSMATPTKRGVFGNCLSDISNRIQFESSSNSIKKESPIKKIEQLLEEKDSLNAMYDLVTSQSPKKKSRKLDTDQNKDSHELNLKACDLFNELDRCLKIMVGGSFPKKTTQEHWTDNLITIENFDLYTTKFRSLNDKMEPYGKILRKKPFGLKKKKHIELPDLMLQKIFENLNYADLSSAEQVNSQWNKIAKLVWSSKRELSTEALFSFNYDLNEYGVSFDRTEWTKKSFVNAFAHYINNKLDCQKLRKANLSYMIHSIMSEKVCAQCLSLVADNCPNLESIELSSFIIQNTSSIELNRLFQNIKDTVKKVVFSSCKGIDDTSVLFILNNCLHLEEFSIGANGQVTGQCFRQINEQACVNMKKVKVNICSKFTGSNLIPLVSKTKDLTDLCLTYNEKANNKRVDNSFLTLIVNAAPQLQRFECTVRFSNYGEQLSRLNKLTHIHLCNHITLKSSDVAQFLNKIPTLKYLNLWRCTKLTDLAFTSLPINAKLEFLDISYCKRLTDKSLASIASQNSLVSLIIAESRFSLSAIFSLVESLLEQKLYFVDLNSSQFNCIELAKFFNRIIDLIETRKPDPDRKIRFGCKFMHVDKMTLIKDREFCVYKNQSSFSDRYSDEDDDLYPINLMKIQGLELEHESSFLREDEEVVEDEYDDEDEKRKKVHICRNFDYRDQDSDSDF